MSPTEKVKDEGDGFERIDVRSRIAALNGQNRTTASKHSPNIVQTDLKTNYNQTKDDEIDTPKLDVKSLSALYGGKSAGSEKKDSNIVKETKPENEITNNESIKPPVIPSRPVIQTKNGVPPQPPVRPQGSSDTNGPPQLPPRLKEGSTSRSSTPTSINSDRTIATDSPLPYVPRRPMAGRQATIPAGRSTEDITEKAPYATREKTTRKGMSISSSSESINTSKIAPTLPPRIQMPKSADAAQNSFPASNTSKMSKSSNTKSLKTSGPVAPPPRHVDTIRVMPKVATRIDQNGGGKLNSDQLFKQKRAYKRDEHSQMIYSLDPEPKDEQRYARLYELQIALQAQKGGSAKVLEQKTIVRLWKRSKLDPRFLQKVYDEACGGAGKDVYQTEFIQAMAAIDRELARRKK